MKNYTNSTPRITVLEILVSDGMVCRARGLGDAAISSERYCSRLASRCLRYSSTYQRGDGKDESSENAKCRTDWRMCLHVFHWSCLGDNASLVSFDRNVWRQKAD